METSRLIRRKRDNRLYVTRVIGIACKTAVIGLLLISWFLDRQLLFTIVLLNLTLALLFTDYYNVRRCLPGVNSAKPLTRVISIIVYVLCILVIVSYAA